MFRRIALGTVQFGMKYGISNQEGQVSPIEIKSILKCALEMGVDTLDTAISYKDSEKYLGMNDANFFKIVTKIPPIPNSIEDVRGWCLNQFNSSLIKLNTCQIYGLLLHSPEDLLGTNGPAIYGALNFLKQTGKVKKIGISINTFKTIAEIINTYKIDLIQVPFNIIDRRLLNSGILKILKDKDIEIHTRSAFLQGLLLMSEIDRPPEFSKWNNIWNQWASWLSDNSITALDGAIKYALSCPEIDKVIIGVQSSKQLTEISSSIMKKNIYDFPDIQCVDENLINPSKWLKLQ